MSVPTLLGRSAPRDAIDAVPLRHPGRWAAGLVIVLIAAFAGQNAATNSRYGWATVQSYLFDPRILAGVRATLLLTVLSMLIGLAVGMLLTVMRLSPNPIVRGAAWSYVWVFRGTPLLVQLLFWNFLGSLYPVLGLGIPFGPTFVSGQTNVLIPTFGAALLGLGLNEAAYMAEIVRAGIASVPEGQRDAADALGMSRLLSLRRIVLPQAMRVIIPPIGNDTISMLKTTSMVAFIGETELLLTAQKIYTVTYQTIPMLIVISLWYLALTSVLSVGQYYLERHFGRGATRKLTARPRRALARGYDATATSGAR